MILPTRSHLGSSSTSSSPLVRGGNRLLAWIALLLVRFLLLPVHAFLPPTTVRLKHPEKFQRIPWIKFKGAEGILFRNDPQTKKAWHLQSFSPLTTTELDPEKVLSDELINQISTLVEERGQARWNSQYEHADQLKEQIIAIPLPEGLELHLQDVPRSRGGGSTWIIRYSCPNEEMNHSTKSNPSVLQLAHAALGLAVSSSKTMTPNDGKQSQLTELIAQAKEPLREWKRIQDQIIISKQSIVFTPNNNQGWVSIETQLRGRKAADSAFWFALAGVVDTELFDLLALVCTKELYRFGSKPSCRSKDILLMMDRLAAAGIRSDDHPELETVARACLQAKQDTVDDDADHDTNIQKELLDLHSDRCLLALWKFSARHKKQQFFLQSARKLWEQQRLNGDSADSSRDKSSHDGIIRQPPVWHELFKDPTQPLVVDVGCGMGISLLGLASMEGSHASSDNALDRALFDNCNLLGVDLSGLAGGYAQGVAERWGLSHRLQFTVDSAEALLESVRDSYPGPVSLCLIQFPTPYRLETTDSSSSGNSQLPRSALDGFMVSPSLLRLVKDVLYNNSTKVAGKLLLQSNCEDVALWMQKAAKQEGFEALVVPSPVSLEHINGRNKALLPQRTLNWIAMGGERALGDTWSSMPLLPEKGTTETETACRLNITPIHRCLLSPSQSATP